MFGFPACDVSSLRPLTVLICFNITSAHVRVCTPVVAGKLAGLDKKLSKSLDQEVQTSGTSPLQMSASPVGPLAESSRYAKGMVQ